MLFMLLLLYKSQRQSELSGLRPDTSSLVYIMFIVSQGKLVSYFANFESTFFIYERTIG